MRDEGGLAKGAGEGWSYPFWSKACDLFVYLNVLFRSYQFEEEEQEVPSTFVANIHQHCVSVPVQFVRACLVGKGGAMIGLRALEG